LSAEPPSCGLLLVLEGRRRLSWAAVVYLPVVDHAPPVLRQKFAGGALTFHYIMQLAARHE